MQSEEERWLDILGGRAQPESEAEQRLYAQLRRRLAAEATIAPDELELRRLIKRLREEGLLDSKGARGSWLGFRPALAAAILIALVVSVVVIDPMGGEPELVSATLSQGMPVRSGIRARAEYTIFLRTSELQSMNNFLAERLDKAGLQFDRQALDGGAAIFRLSVDRDQLVLFAQSLNFTELKIDKPGSYRIVIDTPR